MRTLVTGGVKSGKSSYALVLAQEFAEPRFFLATAEAFDDEMKARIAKHREDRAGRFTTIEEPLAIQDKVCDRMILDCVPLWLNNMLYYGREAEIEAVQSRKFIEAPAARHCHRDQRDRLGIHPRGSAVAPLRRPVRADQRAPRRRLRPRRSDGRGSPARGERAARTGAMTIAAPSWQIPGTWLENLDALADIDWIGGVELLFFSYDEAARRDFAAERGRIAAYADRFSFSLHLPDPLGPAVARPRRGDRILRRFVRVPSRIPPSAGDASADAWARTVETLCDSYGASRFAMEYTGAAGLQPWLGAPEKRSSRAARYAGHGAENLRRHGAPRPGRRRSRRRGSKIAQRRWPNCTCTPRAAARIISPSAPRIPGFPRSRRKPKARDWRVVLETFSLEKTRASYDCLKRWLE